METRNYKFKLDGAGDWRDDTSSFKSALCWAIQGETYCNGRLTFKVVEMTPDMDSEGEPVKYCHECDLDPFVCKDYPRCHHKLGTVVYRKVR
jgi:hypothetical protein